MSRPSLLRDRRFGPLLATAFLGAMNDNVLRSAVVVIAAMTLSAEEAASMALWAGAALSLPFVLFSGLSGTAADRFEKAGLLRAVKFSEMILAALSGVAIMSGSLPFLIFMIFLMGTQSTLFGPLKQGWLPERLDRDELLGANAWMESGTFLAILGGTIIGGLSIVAFGPGFVAALLLILATSGF